MKREELNRMYYQCPNCNKNVDSGNLWILAF